CSCPASACGCDLVIRVVRIGWFLVHRQRVLCQFVQQHIYRLLELWIVSLANSPGIQLDFDVRSNACILNFPIPSRRPETATRSRYHTAIDEQLLWPEEPDKSSPRSLSDQWSDLQLAEVERHCIPTGTGILIDDHCLRSLNQAHRPRRILSIARGSI